MKINKCPKCGREPSEVQLIHPLSKSQEILGYEVECYDCGLHTGSCETRDEAATKWNALIKNFSSRGE